MSQRRMRPSARCGSGPRATTCRSCRGAHASGPLTKSSRGSALGPGPPSPPPGTEPMAEIARRRMSLVGFMQAGSTSVYAGSWRHPATEHGFLTAGYYQKMGRTLEEGCFDLMFFDDRLAMPGIYGGSVADAVRLDRKSVV